MTQFISIWSGQDIMLVIIAKILDSTEIVPNDLMAK